MSMACNGLQSVCSVARSKLALHPFLGNGEELF